MHTLPYTFFGTYVTYTVRCSYLTLCIPYFVNGPVITLHIPFFVDLPYLVWMLILGAAVDCKPGAFDSSGYCLQLRADGTAGSGHEQRPLSIADGVHGNGDNAGHGQPQRSAGRSGMATYLTPFGCRRLFCNCNNDNCSTS